MNEPGDPDLERNFKMLAGMDTEPKMRPRCNPPHEGAVFCNNCEPPGWFEAMKVKQLPDEVMVTPQVVQTERVQLVVLRSDGTYRYYPMNKYPGGWKIDPTERTLIIGKGMGRKIIPLETIDSFGPEVY